MFKWSRIKAGEYESHDGRFAIERQGWAEESTGAPDEERGATEWFLYDGDHMVDGYPTLREAKAAAVTYA